MSRLKECFIIFAGLLLLVLPLLNLGFSHVLADSTNLIPNSSLEQSSGNLPVSWHTDHWGNNKPTFTYQNNGHSGNRSIYVKNTTYKNGDAKWYFDPVSVSPDTEYNFYDYYKSSIWTDVIVQFRDVNGGVSYKWISGATASSSWRKLSTSFKTPSNVKSLSIFHLLDGKGWLQTDDYSLTQVPQVPPATGNVVPNASLETPGADDPNQPEGWQTNKSKTNDAAFSYINEAHSGNRSVEVQINNYTSGDAYWSYGSQPVEEAKTYEFSDWYKSNVNTEIYADITMQDGSEQWQYIGTAWHSDSWNKFYTQFSMPVGAVSANLYHTLFSVGYLITDDYQMDKYTPVGFNRGLVSLTFDDSIRSTYTYGLPIMDKYGFKTTQYFLTGYTNDPYYMTIDMMKAFRNDGHEIASHTLTHPHLIDLSSSDVDMQLSQSQADLYNWLGVKPTDFATPFGEYNAETLAEIKKYYVSHRSVDVGFNSKDNFDIYNIKVQNIVKTTTVAEVSNWVAQAQAQHTWLVLVYHAVDPGTAVEDYWNTPPDQLDAQFAAIKSSGVTVKPINQALSEVLPQL